MSGRSTWYVKNLQSRVAWHIAWQASTDNAPSTCVEIKSLHAIDVDDFEAFADHIVNATSADAIEDDPDEEAEELLQGLKNLLTNNSGGA